MFMGVLGYEPDLGRVRALGGEVVAATAPAVTWASGTAPTPPRRWSRVLAGSGGVPYLLRSPAALESVFDGLAFVEPGLVEISRWQPDDTGIVPIEAYGGVARKP